MNKLLFVPKCYDIQKQIISNKWEKRKRKNNVVINVRESMSRIIIMQRRWKNVKLRAKIKRKTETKIKHIISITQIYFESSHKLENCLIFLV